ncbi:MAG: cohesin domain-containing protein [Candidatus Thiodiazotropha endolucinida]
MMWVKLIVLLVLMFFGSIQAATVSLSPDRSSVSVGDQFSVEIIGSDFLSLGGGTMDLGMDDRVQVQAISIDSYWDFLPSSIGSSQSPEVWTGIEFSTLFNPPASGDFLIATIVFEAMNAGISNLSILQSSEFYDPSGVLFPDTIASQVIVSPVPLPPAIWLFAMGLMGMFRFTATHRIP